MDNSNWIRTFGIALGVLGIIGASIAGGVFQAQDINAYTYSVTTHYNWTLAISAGIGVLITSAFFLALASILEQLRSISEDVGSAKSAVNRIEKGLSAAASEPLSSSPAGYNPAGKKNTAVPMADAYVSCSKCGELQPSNLRYCSLCGNKLK